MFDYAWDSSAYVKTRSGWVIPGWIRDLTGDCMFAEVRHVYLGMGKATDENISDFDFRYFNSVEFTSSPLTNSALTRLNGQNQLKSLGLSHSNITDDGLKELATLANLEKLSLADTRVTDSGLTYLAGLKNLNRLILIDTDVTDSGVAELRKSLPRCQIAR